MACWVFMFLRLLKEITAVNYGSMDNQGVYKSDDVHSAFCQSLSSCFVRLFQVFRVHLVPLGVTS